MIIVVESTVTLTIYQIFQYNREGVIVSYLQLLCLK